MRRGEIWAALGRPEGSEPGYRRPVVILQTNELNESPIQTVVVVTVTSNTRLAQSTWKRAVPEEEHGFDEALGGQRLASGDDRQETPPGARGDSSGPRPRGR